jgi:hypothetical protein
VWTKKLRKEETLNGRPVEGLTREEAWQLLPQYHTIFSPEEKHARKDLFKALCCVAGANLQGAGNHPLLHFLTDGRQARMWHGDVTIC